MSPRRTREQPRQNNANNDHGDYTALEAELHAKQPRGAHRAVERTVARAEAEGFTRVTGHHAQSRPVA